MVAAIQLTFWSSRAYLALQESLKSGWINVTHQSVEQIVPDCASAIVLGDGPATRLVTASPASIFERLFPWKELLGEMNKYAASNGNLELDEETFYLYIYTNLDAIARGITTKHGTLESFCKPDVNAEDAEYRQHRLGRNGMTLVNKFFASNIFADDFGNSKSNIRQLENIFNKPAAAATSSARVSLDETMLSFDHLIEIDRTWVTTTGRDGRYWPVVTMPNKPTDVGLKVIDAMTIISNTGDPFCVWTLLDCSKDGPWVDVGNVSSSEHSYTDRIIAAVESHFANQPRRVAVCADKWFSSLEKVVANLARDSNVTWTFSVSTKRTGVHLVNLITSDLHRNHWRVVQHPSGAMVSVVRRDDDDYIIHITSNFRIASAIASAPQIVPASVPVVAAAALVAPLNTRSAIAAQFELPPELVGRFDVWPLADLTLLAKYILATHAGDVTGACAFEAATKAEAVEKITGLQKEAFDTIVKEKKAKRKMTTADNGEGHDATDGAVVASSDRSTSAAAAAATAASGDKRAAARSPATLARLVDLGWDKANTWIRDQKRHTLLEVFWGIPCPNSKSHVYILISCSLTNLFSTSSIAS